MSRKRTIDFMRQEDALYDVFGVLMHRATTGPITDSQEKASSGTKLVAGATFRPW